MSEESENEIRIRRKMVLSLTAGALFNDKTALKNVMDELNTAAISSREEFWDGVLKELKLHAGVLLAVKTLRSERTEELRNVAAKWESISLKYIAGNMKMTHAHEKIHLLMTENGIRYVFLKGIASSSYYPDPSLRALGDVDFLVDKKDVKKAADILKKEGFVSEDKVETSHHHLHFSKKGTHVELHFGFNGIPEGKEGEKIEAYLEDILDKAVPYGESKLMIPSDFHHGLVILLHNAHHMLSEGFGLRHLCDWAVFVNRMGDKFPELFGKPLKEAGIWNYANILTAVSSYAAGHPKQSWCREYDNAFLERVLDDIYDSGNFGRKKVGDSSSRLVQNTNERISNAGMLRRAVSSMNHTVRYHWPIAEKLVFLYPPGWVFFLIRYEVRVLMGKRKKIKIAATVESAAKRNLLYNEFRLFEPDDDADKI